MKFTLAVSILLSAPALGYTPNANFKQPLQNQPTASSSALGYVEDTVAFIETPEMEWLAMNDPATAALKNSLGFSELAIREEYSNWLMQYGKVADESRYSTYKKNLLMQEDYNRRVGAAFTLNEYGDMTEQEYYQMKAQAVAAVEELVVDEPVVEEPETVGAEELQVVEAERVVLLEEPLVESKAVNKIGIKPRAKVEIIDETEIFVEKYKSIEDAEERAFEVLKDLNLVQPAPQHFSFSYVDGAPELKLESGSSYMDALYNPELSRLDGSGTMSSSYLSSMPTSDSSTFEKGKSGASLGASTHYLEDICDMLEPFMDCGKERTPISITSPVEDFVHHRAAQLKSLGDKAFQVLVELCSIGRCERV
eukprot:CAMPEP_0117035896 /NCGR_PEP_ID=MMETSP0472-20121206/25468_1 /TAXON_ID=693140 ORGANISM="Tiarina fusus, Strain LIS" /NCGR_SAMPLE_ID=MMETSP0472 /ASSEMBLY_ACC=CAM_ASM_000603 /LENGTH=365 /DNA_ID=CAMNT_0004745507 /DNA_START=63 /DNA_END=1160 /DNA_ORIENTATION=+